MNATRSWFWLAFSILMIALLKLLAPVLTPFMVAALLAYIADPIVDWLETKGAPRTLGVIAVFVIILGMVLFLLLIILPILARQIMLIPAHIAWLQAQLIPLLQPYLNASILADIKQLDVRIVMQTYWKEAGGLLVNVLQQLTQSGAMLIAWLVNCLLIPVIAFYLLRDWNILMTKVHQLFPQHRKKVLTDIALQSHAVLSAFMRGQLMVMLVLSLIYTFGLYWVGIESFLLIGVIAGVLSFVPYLGLIIGVVLAGFAAYIQYGVMLPVLQVALIFGVAQMIEMLVLTPCFVGDRVGLHPVVVIFAILVGGELFGFIGVLLALPVAAVVLVVLRFLKQHYLQSEIYVSNENS